MDDINTLKQTAGSLRKEKSYDKAIKVYESLWRDHAESCDEWDGWGYAFSLRKVGNSALAYDVAQKVHEKWPNFNYNNSVLGWCMYDLFINKDIEATGKNESDFFQAASKILGLPGQDKFSPHTRTVFKVIDYLEESRNNFPAEAIVSWLDKLDKSKLSLETGEGQDDKGRTITHASDLEKWYAKKCKALYKMGRYQDCIKLGSEALSCIREFHYNNDKWIAREVALSHGQTGNPKEGILMFEKIMDSRAEWFLYFDIASLFYKDGQIEKALRYAAQAALARQDSGFKIEVFEFMGRVLLEKGEISLAQQHLLLSQKIRVEREWKVSNELQELLVQSKVNQDENITSKDLEKSLTKHWQSIMYSGKKQGTGMIKNIVSSGKSGFIVDSDKKEYYFRVNEFRGNPSFLKPGLRVSFYSMPSNEPGKLDSAVNVAAIKD